MVKEEWKDIKGFEGFYKISNKGRVHSITYNKCEHCGREGKLGRFLKSPVLKAGYRMVAISKPGMGAGISKTFLVHRLVAMHFVNGETAERNQVNHKDGNKTNNIFTNLEWVTRSENQKHAIRFGLATVPKYVNPWPARRANAARKAA